MRRRVGVVLLGLVAAVFVAADSAWACKFLDGFLSRIRSRRCCETYCRVDCEPVEVTCCAPAVCEPVAEKAAVPAETPAVTSKETPPEVPKETPAEAPAEKPAEQPAVQPPVAPAEKPVEEPAVQPPVEPAEKPPVVPAEKPAEQPAVQPPVEPAIVPPTKPAGMPAETPSGEPAVTPPPKPAEMPAAPPADDPFSRHETGGGRPWTDISGKHHVQASFVSFQDGTVRLKKSNGRYCRIVIEKLSLADRAFVRRQIESIATTW